MGRVDDSGWCTWIIPSNCPQIRRACSRGSEAKIYIKVMGMSPGQAVTTDVPDAAGRQMMPRVTLSSIFCLFIRQWHHDCSSLRHLGA